MIYFGFSDESGDFKTQMSDIALNKHPFYIRSLVIINATDWKYLKETHTRLKIKYELPEDKEIKWAYLWAIRIHQKSNRKIKDYEDFKFLETYPYSKLIEFADEFLGILHNLSKPKIIFTYTDNRHLQSRIKEYTILKMHFEEIIPRFEMEINNNIENLGILFIDPINPVKNEFFRKVYFDIFNNGEFIHKYSHIKDSLNMENSHHSVGIQLADFICGAFNAYLRSNERKGFEKGSEFFYNHVLPHCCRKNGIIQGIGIREVPRDETIRNKYGIKIEKYYCQQGV